MAFFEGNNMTAGYGDGPDIISSCTLNADKGEIVAACIFGLSNNNTWAVKKVNVIELVRLVRKEGIKASKEVKKNII